MQIVCLFRQLFSKLRYNADFKLKTNSYDLRMFLFKKEHSFMSRFFVEIHF